MKKNLLFLLLMVFGCQFVFGQNYAVTDTRIFKPQEKKVLLFSKNAQARKLILFYSKLRVNTDGTERSYHPEDFDGTSIAINSLCNAISVFKKLPNGTESKLKCADSKEIFNRFKLNNWVEPVGYRITWKNVIAERAGKPCIFQEGEYKGYFGSLTSAKNDLQPAQSGECQSKNQLDALTIPNLVLASPTWKDQNGVSYQSPLQIFGAKKEDLVFAYNEETRSFVYAIIGDVGPPDNLGEGSVSLNMKLLARTEFPKNYTEAKKFDTGTKKILTVIIPNSKSYKLQKPYTKENIEKRGKEILQEMGFANEQSFINFLLAQRNKF